MAVVIGRARMLFTVFSMLCVLFAPFGRPGCNFSSFAMASSTALFIAYKQNIYLLYVQIEM